MLLYILCIYLSLYFNVHIIVVVVVGLYCCVCFPRWVLDHLLGYVWEIPLGGKISSNLGIKRFYYYCLLILCHHIYFKAINIPFLFYVFLYTFKQSPSPFHFMLSHLISCTSPLLFYFIALIYIYIYRHLNK